MRPIGSRQTISREEGARTRYIAVLVMLFSSAAGADPAPSLSSRSCPALFGDEATRRANRDYRRRYLHWVQQETAGITVAHSNSDWGTPVQLIITGIELVESAPDASSAHAVLDVAPRIASAVGCSAGRYRLADDDGISPRTRVLAILRGLLLVDHDGKAGFIAGPGALSPHWLMAWRVRGIMRPRLIRARAVPPVAPHPPPATPRVPRPAPRSPPRPR